MTPAVNTGHPCEGFQSIDIGVIQSNSTSPDESLQRDGNGTVSGDFTWEGPIPKTRDQVNTNQTFGTEPTTFVVTAAGLDYIIDGVMHATITVKRGETYIFDVSDFGNAHPFRLSTTSDGAWNGGFAYDNGVTYVNQGTITWTVPEDLTNSTMYYWCTLHPGMAGSGVIQVID